MSCAARSSYGPPRPKPLMDAQINRGWRARSVSASTPRRRAVDGRKLSTTTSLRAASVSRTAAASRDLRSSVRLRLLRLRISKWRFRPFTSGGSALMASPPRGSSILTTSAPRSASRSVAYAPGSRRVRSSTRTPSSGRIAQVTTINTEQQNLQKIYLSASSARSSLFAVDMLPAHVQLAVREAIREVQRETDREPDAEALPRRPGEAVHDEHASRRRQEAHGPDKRHPERPRPIGLLVAQHEHADAHEDEREQRPDVRQVVGFRGGA